MRFITYFHSILVLRILLTPQTTRGARGQVDGEEQRHFADSLTNELYINDNECTCSCGVSMLFDLLRPGSSGETLNQICQVVGLCGAQDALLWNETVTALAISNTGECMDSHSSTGECYRIAPLITIANSIWIDINSILQPDYSEIVGEYLQLTDFSSQDAGRVVNDWVNHSSRGYIDSIVDEGPLLPYRLVAINSIYLEAYWQDQFWEALTNEDLFYKDASRDEALPNKAHFMHRLGSVPYSDTALPGYQVISLDYHGDWDNKLSMILVLPLFVGAASVSSNDVVNILPLPDAVDPTEERPFGRGVALAVPKFRIESNYETTLKDSLMQLGLTAPFEEQNGFCGLLEGEECLFIDRLIQKTFIEVNEVGTIAAAITLALLPGSGLPPDAPVLFLADHPFQFFIYDSMEDLVIFEGRVGAPTISDDWSPAQLQAVHSDPDFWTANFHGLESPPIQPTPPTTTQPTPPTTTQPTPPTTTQPTPPTTTQPTPPATTQPTPPTTTQPTPPTTTQPSAQTTQQSTTSQPTDTTQPPVQPTQPSTVFGDDPDSSALLFKGFSTVHWIAFAVDAIIMFM